MAIKTRLKNKEQVTLREEVVPREEGCLKKICVIKLHRERGVAKFPAVNPIPKKSLPEAVAAELRQRIEMRSLQGRLPGVRLLSRSLGVSVPTVCRALHLLKEEGVLDAGGKRRRWAVSSELASSRNNDPARPVRTAPRSKRAGRLLFLSSQPLSSERHSGVEVFAEILDLLGTKGWEVMHRVVDFSSAKKPRQSWDPLLKMTRPDAMVALGGTPVLARWATHHGIRTLFLGGDAGESGVPLLAVKVSTMLRQVFERLLLLGHRRVLVPMCGRSQSLIDRAKELAMEIASETGASPGSIIVQETAYARPEVLVNLLRSHWKKNPPDALIFLDWREFVAACSHFDEARVIIPRDASVAILSQNSTMDWHIPPIGHFEHPVKSMARTVSKWVTDARFHTGYKGTFEVAARWVEGKSIISRK